MFLTETTIHFCKLLWERASAKCHQCKWHSLCASLWAFVMKIPMLPAWQIKSPQPCTFPQWLRCNYASCLQSSSDQCCGNLKSVTSAKNRTILPELATDSRPIPQIPCTLHHKCSQWYTRWLSHFDICIMAYVVLNIVVMLFYHLQATQVLVQCLVINSWVTGCLQTTTKDLSLPEVIGLAL